MLPVGMVAERSVHYFCVAPIGVHALPIGIAVLQSVHYFGPSGVRALPLSQLQNEVSPIFGPSRVRVLPVGVAEKRSVHYFCDYCQAQPQLQVKLSLKAELALFSINPDKPLRRPDKPLRRQTPPTRESLFSNISQ